MNSQIDVILLDLNITKVNGIQILEKIKESNISTEVIVISGEAELIVEIISKKLSVNQILVKPFQIDELINCLNLIIADFSQKNIENEKDIKILRLLNKFNFNKANMGYAYIIDCLNFCIEKEYTYIGQTKELYKSIAEQYKEESYTKISWNISKCIQVMNKLTDKNILKKYFPYDDTPSPKTFLNEILHRYYMIKR